MRKYGIVAGLAFVLLGSIYACSGGGGGGQDNVPAAAKSMSDDLKSKMGLFFPLVSPIENSLIFVMNPGTTMAQGVTVTDDLTPGALPNSVTFAGPFDGNNDGFKETTMSGKATFNSAPASGWSGMSGTAAVDVNIPIIGHLYHSDLAFTINDSDQRLISGSGTFTDPLSGNVTTMTVPAGSPLIIKPATSAAGAAANACSYSIDGAAQLRVEGASGILSALWSFSSNNPTVAVSGASYTDTVGKTIPLPDTTVDLRCAASGSINDWAATYNQSYSCLPRETGQATLTLAVTGPDTITITDEDPPGSGNTKTYTATIVGANSHSLRGFFIGGPVGNHYREDFTWTLSKNSSSFSQISLYKYTEGLNTGSGGICSAYAKRVP